MLFNSISYAVFFPTVLLIYYVLPQTLRLWVLLLSSCLFYAAWNPLFLPLIIGLTAINFVFGHLCWRFKGTKAARAVLIIAIVCNLGTLAGFKYALFLAQSFYGGLEALGVNVGQPEFSIILPLGISFFTFEFIHYQVDVFKGQEPIASPLKFVVFAAFFPTQIAGPIKRFEDFVPQLESRRPLTLDQMGQGVRLLLWGLFKKAVLADNLAPLVAVGFQAASPIKSPMTATDAWLVTLAFALQIYFDFSGYTDMGRGSARLLGFQVAENFVRPYLSQNISEFWKRWHISLSSWLRDYLYIPLGGNRKHRYRNLLITMLLGGLWHGANWTFVIWGGLHGLYLISYHFLSSRGIFSKIAPEKGYGKILWRLGGWLLTFALVCIGWVFFRAANIYEARAMLGAMLGFNSGETQILLSNERLIICIIALGTLLTELLIEKPQLVGRLAQMRNTEWFRTLKPVGYTLLFSVIILLHPAESTRFIYFQF